MDSYNIYIWDSEDKRAKKIKKVFLTENRNFTIEDADRLTTDRLFDVLVDFDLVILNLSWAECLAKLFNEIDTWLRKSVLPKTEVVIYSCKDKVWLALVTKKNYWLKISSRENITDENKDVKRDLESYFQRYS